MPGPTDCQAGIDGLHAHGEAIGFYSNEIDHLNAALVRLSEELDRLRAELATRCDRYEAALRLQIVTGARMRESLREALQQKEEGAISCVSDPPSDATPC